MEQLIGISQDEAFAAHSQNKARYALNAVFNRFISKVGNERGNKIVASLKPGYYLIGYLFLDNSSICLFSTNEVVSEIGIFYKNTYTSVITRTDFNFKYTSNIEGVFKRDSKGNIIIYWLDKHNIPRTANLTLPIPNSDPNIDKFNWFYYTKNVPIIKLSSVEETGGILRSGVYFVFIALEDSSGVITPYFSNSLSIIVTNSTIGNGFNAYEGVEGEVETDKLIKLQVTNIDVSFKYLHVAFVPQYNGITSTGIKLNKIPITANQINIQYAGNETTEDITLEDLTIRSAVYNNAEALTQDEGYIYLAGLTSNPDINLQPYVNLLTIEAVTKEIQVTTIDKDNSVKDALAYNSNRTAMPNEAYALYISFFIEGGIETKAYHIPGRDVETPLERELISVVKNSVSLFDNAVAATILDEPLYFHIYNKEIVVTSTMGFWENDTEFYPDNSDFNTSINGSEILANKKVRHHRFPDISSNFYNGTNKTTVITGIKVKGFNNIPNDIKRRIIGYKIYYAKRTGDNNLVQTLNNHSFLDLLQYFNSGGEDDQYQPDFLNTSPAINVQDKIFIRDEYLANSGLSESSVNYIKSLGSYKINQLGNPVFQNNPGVAFLNGFLYSSENNDFEKRNEYYIRKITEAKIIKHNNTIPEFGTINKPIKSTTGDGIVLNLSTRINYISNSDLDIIQVYNAKKDLYNSYDSQTLVSLGGIRFITGNESESMFEFDCFPTYYALSKRQSIRTSASVTANNIYYHYFFTVSKYNYQLRHSDADNVYYPKYFVANPISNQNNVISFVEKHSSLLLYNVDFNTFSLDLTAPGINLKNKIEDVFTYPTRLIRTLKDSNSLIGDNNRFFNIQDYIDLPRNRGKITKLIIYKDNLLAHCNRGFFLSKGKEILAFNDVRAYIGSGDILSIPPGESISTPIGFGGLQHKSCSIVTEDGYLFLDVEANKIFWFSSKLDIISDNDLKLFFENNLQPYLYSYGFVPEYNAINNLGYVLNYDPVEKRLLITKLDYKPTEKFITDFNDPTVIIGSDRIYYSKEFNRFFKERYNQLFQIEKVFLDFNNTTYFTKSNYTVSFSLAGNPLSFHSYTPYAGFYSLTNMYYLETKNIYEHSNYDNPCLFFGVKYPFIIELVKNAMPDNNKLLNSIVLTTSCENEKGGYENETFNTLVVYNSFQVALLENIDNIFKKKLRDSYINKFRNIIKNINEPIIIGNEINFDNLDLNKDWFKKEFLIDRFFVFRFTYNNSKQNKLYLENLQISVEVKN